MVKDRRQGRILLVVMGVLWAVSVLFASFAETNGNPELTARGADQSVSAVQSGGNMEGKELRFGPDGCGLWAGSTTGTSNGSVNCMHDSMTPLGGAVPLANMMLGEVSPGGVGVGLMGCSSTPSSPCSSPASWSDERRSTWARRSRRRR